MYPIHPILLLTPSPSMPPLPLFVVFLYFIYHLTFLLLLLMMLLLIENGDDLPSTTHPTADAICDVLVFHTPVPLLVICIMITKRKEMQTINFLLQRYFHITSLRTKPVSIIIHNIMRGSD